MQRQRNLSPLHSWHHGLMVVLLGVGICQTSLGTEPATAWAERFGTRPEHQAREQVQPSGISVQAPQRLPQVATLSAPEPSETGARPLVVHSATLPQRLPSTTPTRLASTEMGVPAPLAPPAAVLSAMHTQPYCDNSCDFAPTPIPAGAIEFDAETMRQAYDGKTPVPTQRPWVELGVPFYKNGTLPPANTMLGFFNPIRQRFLLYGDYRVGVGGGENAIGNFHNVAQRLNLEADWQITATGRFHGAVQPLTQGVQFTGVDFSTGSPEYVEAYNVNFLTGWYESDLGVLVGNASDTPAPFDLPFAVGLLPLFYQNGIWADDAVVGAAVALPARHSTVLDWPNFDITFFAALDEVNSPAFGQDKDAGRIFGTAWFIEAYKGYIEADWAYVYDYDQQGRTYHNIGLAYTRRYFNRVSNSVRVILNAGQDVQESLRTADGGVFLFESSLISPLPLQLVPYFNAFYGWDRPQSLARAGQAGGILRNTGINFETDGLNGYPTLDANAINTAGGAVGVNWLGLGLDRQVVVEAAYVHGYGNSAARVVQDEEIALGSRFQWPINHCTLIRIDGMYGFRDQQPDLWGTRFEWRWKF